MSNVISLHLVPAGVGVLSLGILLIVTLTVYGLHVYNFFSVSRLKSDCSLVMVSDEKKMMEDHQRLNQGFTYSSNHIWAVMKNTHGRAEPVLLALSVGCA